MKESCGKEARIKYLKAITEKDLPRASLVRSLFFLSFHYANFLMVSLLCGFLVD
jgi:hypothetical protein